MVTRRCRIVSSDTRSVAPWFLAVASQVGYKKVDNVDCDFVDKQKGVHAKDNHGPPSIVCRGQAVNTKYVVTKQDNK